LKPPLDGEEKANVFPYFIGVFDWSLPTAFSRIASARL
jgi:hypothetical protein